MRDVGYDLVNLVAKTEIQLSRLGVEKGVKSFEINS